MLKCSEFRTKERKGVQEVKLANSAKLLWGKGFALPCALRRVGDSTTVSQHLHRIQAQTRARSTDLRLTASGTRLRTSFCPLSPSSRHARPDSCVRTKREASDLVYTNRTLVVRGTRVSATKGQSGAAAVVSVGLGHLVTLGMAGMAPGRSDISGIKSSS